MAYMVEKHIIWISAVLLRGRDSGQPHVLTQFVASFMAYREVSVNRNTATETQTLK